MQIWKNKSMHVSKYLKQSLYFPRDCKSTKSACHCLSIELTITLFRGYVLLSGHSITCYFFSLWYFSLDCLRFWLQKTSIWHSFTSIWHNFSSIWQKSYVITCESIHSLNQHSHSLVTGLHRFGNSYGKTSKDKEPYLTNVFEKECIELDPRNIEKNPGRRALAELMLVYFWGKVN